MRDRERAVVVAFPASLAGRRSFARSSARRAVVLPLRPDCAPDEDPSFSRDWDEISQLASDAWTWRDPESLARLEECVARLWPDVEREWGPRSEPVRRAPRARR